MNEADLQAVLSMKTRWKAMLRRCTKPKDPSYRDYGGRGIKVHPAWQESLVSFLRDVGLPPTRKHSLDRTDNNGHYEPGNVRWALKAVQQNNRRCTRLITSEGRTLPMSQWAEELKVSRATLRYRVKKGLPLAGQKRALPQIARKAEVPYKKLHQRLSRGMPLVEALEKRNYIPRRGHKPLLSAELKGNSSETSKVDSLT